MKVELELWQVITFGVTLIGAFAAVFSMLLRQFSVRIDGNLAALMEEAKGWRQVERDLMALRAELPERYVRREDYIRGQTVIEAKLDVIGGRVEMLQIQGAKGGKNG
jgi:hypothetical protein